MMSESKMDLAKIEQGVRLILEGVGEDPEREGLLKTPERVARMYEECFAGLYEDPAVHFETTFDEHHEELVIVRDIPFYSSIIWRRSSARPTSPTRPPKPDASAVSRSSPASSTCMLAVRRSRSA